MQRKFSTWRYRLLDLFIKSLNNNEIYFYSRKWRLRLELVIHKFLVSMLKLYKVI